MSSKTGVVSRFEIRRAIRRKSFWYATFAPVVIMLIIFGIEKSSINKSTSDQQSQIQDFQKNGKVALLDESGLINTRALPKNRVSLESTQDAGIEAVKDGSVDAFFYYPKNVSTAGIRVYGQDKGISYTPPYDDVATQLLHQNALTDVTRATHNSQAVGILEHDPSASDTTYIHGRISNSVAAFLAPGAIGLAFVMLIVLLGYQMISATTEEKENRSAEMLLTSISPRSLITGKMLAIFALGAIQLAVIALPLAVYALKTNVTLPGNVSLLHIPLDPHTIVIAALFSLGGFILYTGLIVGVGAMFPSSSEAGRFMGIFIIWAFLPVYIISAIISSPHSFIVILFTYFPLTAATTSLMRNALGSLSFQEAWPALLIVYASVAVAAWFAMRAFRFGAMEYGRRINIKELFTNRR